MNKLKFNKKKAPVAFIILLVFSVMELIPIIILFSSSISSNGSIIKDGYSIWPRDFDLTAYRYLFEQSSVILRSLGISIFITAAGTFVSIIITALLAYPLSRMDLPGRKVFSFFVIFTLLFNGGLVPTYMVYTQIFHLKDSIFALIVPNLLVNGFNVIIMRTFFMTSIPDSVIEAAKIDGAGEFRIFRSIVLKLSLPVLATVGLMQAMVYWNDWFNALVYVNNPKLLSLQAVLNQMLNNINFLASAGGSSFGGMGAQTTIPSVTVRMAMAFIGILPFLIIFPFTQRYFIKGITVGAVKG